MQWTLLVITQNIYLQNSVGNLVLRRAVDGITHCGKRLPLKQLSLRERSNFLTKMIFEFDFETSALYLEVSKSSI